MSISKPGSTNGKKPVRIRVRTGRPNTVSRMVSTRNLPAVKGTPSSIRSTSYWKKDRSCQASGVSLQYTRPA